jgi:hypothetical protein
MTHRAAETEAPKVKRNLFGASALPHWAMGIVTSLWLYFQITLGSEGVPGPIQQGFAGCLGMWTTFAFARANLKGDK